MLEYMDDMLGRLFDYIEASPLRDNTYIMIMGDNGSELFDGEKTTEGNLEVRCIQCLQCVHGTAAQACVVLLMCQAGQHL
jgi:arylsulfatase A-like enzyme